jgi:hypothetical protein
MKKLAFLLILTIAMVSFTSCEKEDPAPDGITVNDLVGDWNFQSLEIVGVRTYYANNPTDVIDLDNDYTYGRIGFRNVTTTEIGLFEHKSEITGTWDYTLSNNRINIHINGFSYGIEFHIKNWQTFDGSVLILEVTDKSKYITNTPVRIYTMTR